MDSDNIIFHLKRKKKILQEKINNYDKKKVEQIRHPFK